MPMIEVDENEFRHSQQLRQVLSKVLEHPKAGVLAEQALKMVDPNAATPRLDRMNQIQEPLSEAQKQINELKDQIAADKAEREKHEKLAAISAKVESGKSQLRREGWTEEGIKGVEKIMEDRGLLDPLDAAAIFEKQHPPAMPASPSGVGAWNFMDQVAEGEQDLKKLIETRGESDLLADHMARTALAEVRGQSRR